MMFRTRLQKATHYTRQFLRRLFPAPMQDFTVTEPAVDKKAAYKVAFESPVSTRFAKWFLLNAHAEGGDNWLALEKLLDQRNPNLLRDVVVEANGIDAKLIPSEYLQANAPAFLTLRDMALDKLTNELIVSVPSSGGSLHDVLEMLSPCQLVLENESQLTTLFEGSRSQDANQSGHLH